MSCAFNTDTSWAATPGVIDCAKVYVLPGVTQQRAQEWFDLGQNLGLTEFNPTVTNWDKPFEWKQSETGAAIMSSGAGYAIEIGFGAFFSILTVILTELEKRFAGVATTSEHFNTAGRNVKTGLTASVIVSQWTWAATLLQSSNVAWQYGITGPFWYASGASIQVLVFGILAIEVKRKAPNCHTFLEMIHVRWGAVAHKVFLGFGLLTNAIVSAMLLLGGCAVMDAAAGIPIAASSFLIPLGTLIYTLVGGLKATFLASYLHTTVIFIILMLFVTLVYGYEFDCEDAGSTLISGNYWTRPAGDCTSLGSASIMYERLRFMNALPVRVAAATPMTDSTGTGYIALGFHQGPAHPSRDGNRGGAYLTMMSLPGFLFGIINIVGNFGTVFVDQSYWQSAIAASPASAHKGYLLGGLVWFTIPFALATSLGLAGNALNVALTQDDANAGLVPPASATALLGNSGGVLMIIMLFMAITSTGSAECIAVSSLWSYDCYRNYINKEASGKQILMQSRIVVCVWALVMALLSIILNEIGVSLGWVYNFMGIVIGSAVVPIALVITHNALDAKWAMMAAAGGQICAVIAWLVTAATQAEENGFPSGEISVDTTGILYAQLAGNCVAIGSSGIICLIGSIVSPMNFDWDIMVKGITLVGGDGGENAKTLGDDWESKPEFLLEAKAWIFKYGWAWTVFLTILWPLLAIPFGVFGKSTFQLWASVALCWGWIGGLTIITLPLYENLPTIMRVFTCSPAKAETATKGSVTTETATA